MPIATKLYIIAEQAMASFSVERRRDAIGGVWGAW
jgi:hypothetical protein